MTNGMSSVAQEPITPAVQARAARWSIAFACGIGVACGLASVLTATFQVFLAPLQGEFGWSRPQLFLALTLTLLVVTALAPSFGSLVDRIGARRLILLSLLLEAAVMASFARQTASLPLLYLRYIALAVLGIGTTHVGFARIVTEWFDGRRGFALGIMLAGLGVGNMLWPLLTQTSIDRLGWRNAYLVIAAVIVVAGFGSVMLFVPARPQGAAGVAAAASRAAAVGMSRREALRNRTFWQLMIAFLAIGISISSVQSHMVPLLRSRGVDATLAASVLSVLGAALVLGRLTAGWLMDRVFAPRVAVAFLIGPLLAVALLAAGVTGPWAFLAGLLTGLALGAEMDVTTYLCGRYFGVRNFGAIFAFFYAAYTLGAAFGPLGTAIAVDKSGSYTPVLLVHGALIALGAILLARLPAFPRWES